jgi:hypothetical protein
MRKRPVRPGPYVTICNQFNTASRRTLERRPGPRRPGIRGLAASRSPLPPAASATRTGVGPCRLPRAARCSPEPARPARIRRRPRRINGNTPPDPAPLSFRQAAASDAGVNSAGYCQRIGTANMRRDHDAGILNLPLQKLRATPAERYSVPVTRPGGRRCVTGGRPSAVGLESVTDPAGPQPAGPISQCCDLRGSVQRPAAT